MMQDRLPRFIGPSSVYLVPKNGSPIVNGKIGIDSVTGSITTKPWSHKGAWARIVATELSRIGYEAKVLSDDDKWSDYDTIILDHGMEFNGTFNLYGGANDELAVRIERLLTYQGSLISYEIPMPNMANFVKARSSTCTAGFTKLLDRLDELDAVSKKINFADAVTPTGKLVVGDSHSLSAWEPGWELRRHDGKTLHGALKVGLNSFVYGGDWDAVRIYFGNIDIRHHLCRQPDPSASLNELIDDLVRQVGGMLIDGTAKAVELVHLLPIEDESRKLPKTGYYNGEPFHGSRLERQTLVNRFNDTVTAVASDVDPTGQAFKAISWSHLPLEPDGSLSFAAMERPKSVHISPTHYLKPLVDADTPKPELTVAKPPSEPKRVKQGPTIIVSDGITRNDVYRDLLEYHSKALLLERRARGEDAPLPNDELMCNVHVYDSVHRYCAGFSNLLEDYHFPSRQGKLRNQRYNRHSVREAAYLYLVHRVTGSAASFRPRPSGDPTLKELMASKAHGYCNTIVPSIWQAPSVKDMTDFILEHKGPYLTSKGNIPPHFKAVIGGYDKPSREYLCLHAPELIDHVLEFVFVKKRGIREVVDVMNRWNKARKMNAFSFCYTAFANDMAEYWPNLVDPFSHTYYGPNCVRTLELSYDGSIRPRSKAHDKVMDWLVEDTGFKPLDLEDSPACDIQRYWTEYVPDGYSYLSKAQTENNSILKKLWGTDRYRQWVTDHIHLRKSGLEIKEIGSEDQKIQAEEQNLQPASQD